MQNKYLTKMQVRDHGILDSAQDIIIIRRKSVELDKANVERGFTVRAARYVDSYSDGYLGGLDSAEEYIDMSYGTAKPYDTAIAHLSTARAGYCTLEPEDMETFGDWLDIKGMVDAYDDVIAYLEMLRSYLCTNEVFLDEKALDAIDAIVANRQKRQKQYCEMCGRR